MTTLIMQHPQTQGYNFWLEDSRTSWLVGSKSLWTALSQALCWKKIQWLNDYHPVALTSLVMKWFEELVLALNRKVSLLSTLILLFLLVKRSTEDDISLALHIVLLQLYLWMLSLIIAPTWTPPIKLAMKPTPSPNPKCVFGNHTFFVNLIILSYK